MTSTLRCGVMGRFWPYRTGAMQDRARELRRTTLPRTPVNTAPSGPVRDLLLGPRFGSPLHGYTKVSASYGWQGDTMMDRSAASSRMDHEAESARAEWLSAMRSLAEQIQKHQQTS